MFVFVAVLTSCTNDDITISYATNFKINPATVITPFTFEMNPGELESFGSDHRLRVRLLTYNSEGLLVQENVEYFTNYATLMSCSQNLPDGNYIAIAITDVVSYEGNNVALEYWELSDHDKLAETRIDDNGYIGLQYKILGISKTNFTINGKSNNDISINVSPAGALIFVWYQNIHAFSDVETYGLAKSKTTEGCIFDSQGNYTVSALNNNGSFDWWQDKTDVADFGENVQNVYSFVYILPMSNMNLKFQAITDTGEEYDLSNSMTVSPQAGEEYLFSIDLAAGDSGFNIEYGLVNSKSSNKSLTSQENVRSVNTVLNKRSLYLTDVK